MYFFRNFTTRGLIIATSSAKEFTIRTFKQKINKKNIHREQEI